MTKKSISILIPMALVSLVFSACEKKAQPKPDAAKFETPKTQPVPGQLVVIAELLNISGEFPPNELYNYSYIMKYKITKVISGTYTENEILVGHYNPKIARSEIKDDQDSLVGGSLKSFQVGDTHYLVLSSMDDIWHGASEDNYFNEKGKRYWALWVDKL